MLVTPIKTRPFLPPKDNLDDLLAYITDLQDKDVVVITSKVISICQGRCVEKRKHSKEYSKAKLIAREYRTRRRQNGSCGVLGMIPILNRTNAREIHPYAEGIDESNGNRHFVLLPVDSKTEAVNICSKLKKRFKLKNLTVVITDSCKHHHLGYGGLIGVALSYTGLRPLRSYIGSPDIFGRNLSLSVANVISPLAAAANLVMGEGAELQPIVIIRNVDIPIQFE